jgi:hypothetical protein
VRLEAPLRSLRTQGWTAKDGQGRGRRCFVEAKCFQHATPSSRDRCRCRWRAANCKKRLSSTKKCACTLLGDLSTLFTGRVVGSRVIGRTPPPLLFTVIALRWGEVGARSPQDFPSLRQKRACGSRSSEVEATHVGGQGGAGEGGLQGHSEREQGGGGKPLGTTYPSDYHPFIYYIWVPKGP